MTVELVCLVQELGPGVGKEVNIVFVGGTREEPLGSSGSVSEGEPSADPDTANMLEKPEDVLQKRIKELENLENHLRQQVRTGWQQVLLRPLCWFSTPYPPILLF